MRSLEQRNISWKSVEEMVPSTGESVRSVGVMASAEKKDAIAGVKS